MKRSLTIPATALLMAVSLAACGTGGDDAAAASSERSSEETSETKLAGAGTVTKIDGSTAQLETRDGETTVTWSDSTEFTRQAEGSLKDVEKGDYVLVDGESTGDDAVEADAVAIRDASDAAAEADLIENDDQDDAKDDDKSDAKGGPEGGPDGDRRGGPGHGMVRGEVTEVSDTGFTVEAAERGSDSATEVKVSVDDDTDYLTTVKADADDLEVGAWVQVRGETDDEGDVTASAIEIGSSMGEDRGGLGDRPDRGGLGGPEGRGDLGGPEGRGGQGGPEGRGDLGGPESRGDLGGPEGRGDMGDRGDREDRADGEQRRDHERQDRGDHHDRGDREAPQDESGQAA